MTCVIVFCSLSLLSPLSRVTESISVMFNSTAWLETDGKTFLQLCLLHSSLLLFKCIYFLSVNILYSPRHDLFAYVLVSVLSFPTLWSSLDFTGKMPASVYLMKRPQHRTKLNTFDYTVYLEFTLTHPVAHISVSQWSCNGGICHIQY